MFTFTVFKVYAYDFCSGCLNFTFCATDLFFTGSKLSMFSCNDDNSEFSCIIFMYYLKSENESVH